MVPLKGKTFTMSNNKKGPVHMIFLRVDIKASHYNVTRILQNTNLE